MCCFSMAEACCVDFLECEIQAAFAAAFLECRASSAVHCVSSQLLVGDRVCVPYFLLFACSSFP